MNKPDPNKFLLSPARPLPVDDECMRYWNDTAGRFRLDVIFGQPNVCRSTRCKRLYSNPARTMMISQVTFR